MKIYIAGKITGNPDFEEQFKEAAEMLKAEGHLVMNPAALPLGFDYEDYMCICFAMIDVCDAVYFLRNWKDSPGAKKEREYAQGLGKECFYEKPQKRQILTGEEKTYYVKGRLQHLIHKCDEVHDRLLESIIQETAEDIVNYIEKG